MQKLWLRLKRKGNRLSTAPLAIAVTLYAMKTNIVQTSKIGINK